MWICFPVCDVLAHLLLAVAFWLSFWRVGQTESALHSFTLHYIKLQSGLPIPRWLLSVTLGGYGNHSNLGISMRLICVSESNERALRTIVSPTQ